ncbi:MAG: transcriptional repressor LexA [Thermodesulfobacteriota bacterium]
MKAPLTPKQKDLLKYLKKHLEEKGFPPTIREIASHFGLKSPRGPQKTLQVLERKGYIRRSPYSSRAVEVLNDFSRPLGEGFSIPLVGRVRAGEPILAIENIEGYLTLDRSLISSEDVFLLRVQGDSMIDAHILDGDFVLVKPQSQAENGEIVVALIEDEVTIKRIFKKRSLIRLEPAHPHMEPIIINKGEKKITVIGKVIGIFRIL